MDGQCDHAGQGSDVHNCCTIAGIWLKTILRAWHFGLGTVISTLVLFGNSYKTQADALITYKIQIFYMHAANLPCSY